MTVFIVVGTRENVSQDQIGEAFVPHPQKEIVKGFFNEIDAHHFITDSRLKKPKKPSYGDTQYYKGGYLDMEVESVSLA